MLPGLVECVDGLEDSWVVGVEDALPELGITGGNAGGVA